MIQYSIHTLKSVGKTMTRQSIFITGAASGIGRATAVQFHDRGWFVGATDVDEAGFGPAVF